MRSGHVVLVTTMLAAAATVASTHRTFTATDDEPQHVAAGLDWLSGSSALWSRGHTHYILNPPIARIAVAVLPRLSGLRLVGDDTRELFYGGRGYWTNLSLARLGVLPFLALAIFACWAWARRLYGEMPAAVAAILFATTPPVLGHAGFATTDVAFTALFALTLLAFVRWLEVPTIRRALVLGGAFALGFATKLSVIFLVPVMGVVALLCWGGSERAAHPPSRPRQVVGQLALAALVAALGVWAVFRFSWGVPRDIADPAVFPHMVDTCFARPWTRALGNRVLSLPMPAPEIADAFLYLCQETAPGQSTSYLFGKITQQGFPAFFWVALAVKAPLPLAALAIFGAVVVVRRLRAGLSTHDDRDVPRWLALVPILVIAIVMVEVTPSRLNIGVRHVLPLFPFIAALAAKGAVSLWRSEGRWRRPARALVAVLLGWQLLTPVRAHPDHLAYFNALAGRHPDQVLVDSDLDWGQDLARLEKLTADLHVDQLSIAYFGPGNLCRHKLPPGRWLHPRERATGWVAVSEMYAHGIVGYSYRDADYCAPGQVIDPGPPDPDAFAWLRAHTPVAHAGKSIRLYYIPPK